MQLRNGYLARWLTAIEKEQAAFSKSRPGKRFEDRYFRKRKSTQPVWRKILGPAVGLIIIVLGLILLPAPGPGIPVVLAGCALVAGSFLWMAKLLDRAELMLRSAATVSKNWWKRTSVTVRWAVVITTALLVLAACGGLIWLVLNR